MTRASNSAHSIRLLALDGVGLHPDGDDGAHAARHLDREEKGVGVLGGESQANDTKNLSPHLLHNNTLCPGSISTHHLDAHLALPLLFQGGHQVLLHPSPPSAGGSLDSRPNNSGNKRI